MQPKIIHARSICGRAGEYAASKQLVPAQKETKYPAYKRFVFKMIGWLYLASATHELLRIVMKLNQAATCI